MVGLEFGSELLSRKIGEVPIDDEILHNIQTEIDNLIETILNSEISNDLRTLLLESLNLMRQSILNYRIHGAGGIEQAIKTTLGSIQYYTMRTPPRGVSNDKEV